MFLARFFLQTTYIANQNLFNMSQLCFLRLCCKSPFYPLFQNNQSHFWMFLDRTPINLYCCAWNKKHIFLKYGLIVQKFDIKIGNIYSKSDPGSLMNRDYKMKSDNRFSQMSRIAGIAIPVSTGMLINMISGFVAMTIVAKLGKAELAAGALAIPTFITISTFFSTIFYALSILIRNDKAEGRRANDIGNLIKNGFFLAIVFLVPANLILVNIDRILLIFKQDPLLVSLARPYFTYAALSMIPALFGSVMFQIFLGLGKQKVLMYVSLCTLLPNILLSCCLILGKAGLPRMGLAGVSCAGFIVQTLACIMIMLYLKNQQEIREYSLFSRPFLPAWSICKKIISQGLPIGIQFGAELAVFAVATYLMGYFGIIALAASQISSQYSMLVVMVSLGISQAVSVLTSEAYAKRNFQLVEDYIIAALYILLLVSMIVSSVLIFLPEYLIGAFVDMHNPDNQELIHLAIYLLITAAVIQFFDGIRNLLAGSLRGMQDARAPMNIGIGCLWLISLPVSYIAAFNCNGGPIGLRIGFITGFVIAVLLLWVRIKKKIRVNHSSDSIKHDNIAPSPRSFAE